MKYVRAGLLVSLLVAILIPTAPAFALSGEVVLPFARTYTAPDGTTCTHRGVDVHLSDGEGVEIPAAGTVTFAGRVPGPHGGSVLAVTVDSAGGLITMMPLARIDVQKGDELAEGDSIGTVAAVGDPSSPRPHLHMSLRHGDLYVDSAGLVAAPVSAASSAPQPEPATTPAPDTPVAETPAPVSAPAATPVAAPGVSTGAASPAVSSRSAASGVHEGSEKLARGQVQGASHAVAAFSSSAAVTASAAEVAPGVTLAPRETSAPEVAPVTSAASASPVSRALHASARATAPAARLVAGHLPAALAVAGAVLFGVVVIVTRRALTRRVIGETRVSDRFGTVLQHLKAGDTLCGLTSCSGPLPSQSRGH